MENKNKTIADLNKRTWYRALKTIYILSFSFLLLLCVWIAFSEWEDETIWIFAIIILIAIILQRAFYYIVLGTVNPPSGENQRENE